MIARLLALAAAVAMVLGALAARDRIEEGAAGGEHRPRIVCAPELAAACDALAGRAEVRVEPAAVTAAALSTAAAGTQQLDGWLAVGPWPAVVEERRHREGREPLLSAGAAVARSPLVLAVWRERGVVLRAACGGEPGWRCVGDAAGKGTWQQLGGPPGWGRVAVGLPDPRADGRGFVALGAAAAAFFGRADLSASDLEDDGFRDWLSGLAAAVAPPAVASLERMLPTNAAEVQVVATTEASARAVLSGAAAREKVDVLYPSPVVTADVVPAAVAGRRGERASAVLRRDELRRALQDAGWRTDAAPARPDPAGLPSPGVLEALAGLWAQVRR